MVVSNMVSKSNVEDEEVYAGLDSGHNVSNNVQEVQVKNEEVK